MFKLLIYALLFTTTSIYAQETFTIDGQPCGLEGSAKRANDRALNVLKNRFIAPTKSQIDSKFNWATLALPDDDRDVFKVEKGAILRGYVLKVTMSGAETCNCNSKTPDFRDTHIIITADASETGLANQLVIEITPRMRALMKAKGVDWSQAALKKLKGHYIEVEGWLFYDYKHGDKSAKIKKNSTAVTRATAWEIHPITRLTLIN